jgi:hypothetical protein
MTQDFSEKRDFIRMTINAEVTLHFKGLEFPGTCVDLSSNGMQIKVKADLALGDTLEVHLPSPTPNLDAYHVEAEVVRAESQGDGWQVLGLVTTPA